jgi:hypothetical protein
MRCIRGICPKYTAPNTPSHNPIAEKSNGLLGNMPKAMLLESKLPYEFWAEGMNYRALILSLNLI